jgi:hypothetical protein
LEWCVPNASVGGRVTVDDSAFFEAKTRRLCRVASTIRSSPMTIARWPSTLRNAGKVVKSQTGSTMKLETSADLREEPEHEDTRSARRAPRSTVALHSSCPDSRSRFGVAVRAKPQETRGSQRSKERGVAIVAGGGDGTEAEAAAAAAGGGRGRGGREASPSPSSIFLFLAVCLFSSPSPPSLSLLLLRTITGSVPEAIFLTSGQGASSWRRGKEEEQPRRLTSIEVENV